VNPVVRRHPRHYSIPNLVSMCFHHHRQSAAGSHWCWQNLRYRSIIRSSGSKSRLPKLRPNHVQRLWVTQVEPTISKEERRSSIGTADKTLTCSDCGASFTFTVSEQEMFASRGYTNEPKRCLTCREAKRSSRESSGDSGGMRPRRQMFPTICAQCGKETQVPFQPRGDRPVYCSDCYNKMRPAGGR
jgi:CxxC-x17-CxxC domain-containing protein